jgi:hypothetical protein
MDLANMRSPGVRSLIAYCLNDACRHQAIIDVSSYPHLADPLLGVLVEWRRLILARHGLAELVK